MRKRYCVLCHQLAARRFTQSAGCTTGQSGGDDPALHGPPQGGHLRRAARPLSRGGLMKAAQRAQCSVRHAGRCGRRDRERQHTGNTRAPAPQQSSGRPMVWRVSLTPSCTTLGRLGMQSVRAAGRSQATPQVLGSEAPSLLMSSNVECSPAGGVRMGLPRGASHISLRTAHSVSTRHVSRVARSCREECISGMSSRGCLPRTGDASRAVEYIYLTLST